MKNGTDIECGLACESVNNIEETDQMAFKRKFLGRNLTIQQKFTQPEKFDINRVSVIVNSSSFIIGQQTP